MAFFYASETNRRSGNEDSHLQIEFRVNHEAMVKAMVVADGMGGLSEGKYYSQGAIRIWYIELLKVLMSDNFKECSLEKQTEALKNFMENVFEKINQRLYRKGLDSGNKGGTTLSCVIHFWDTYLIANCGDSPIYIITKEAELSLASEIQNLAYDMVKRGKTKEGTVLFYQNKNRLMEYLGRREKVHPYIGVCEDRDVKGILAGSDGAFGNLSMEEIREVTVHENMDLSLIKQLFVKAKESGEEDNQTAVLYVKDEEIPGSSDDAGKDKVEEAGFPSDVFKEECCYTPVSDKKIGQGIRERLYNKFSGGHKK